MLPKRASWSQRLWISSLQAVQEEQPNIEVTAQMLSSCKGSSRLTDSDKVVRVSFQLRFLVLYASKKALDFHLAVREPLRSKDGKSPLFGLRRRSLLFSDSQVAVLRVLVRGVVVRVIRVVHLKLERFRLVTRLTQSTSCFSRTVDSPRGTSGGSGLTGRSATRGYLSLLWQ